MRGETAARGHRRHDGAVDEHDARGLTALDRVFGDVDDLLERSLDGAGGEELGGHLGQHPFDFQDAIGRHRTHSST